jgi:arylsulfatase A-like enzyme
MTEDMRGTFIARQVERYLEKRKRDGAPFALWVSFMEPHSPFDFPVEGRDEKCCIIAAYYTSVRFPDRNIGIVLHKLAKLGLDRNPLLVYSADHGYFLGQHAVSRSTTDTSTWG